MKDNSEAYNENAILEIVEKESKLTEEQIAHFKAKGKFSATYKPYTTHDISDDLRIKSGRKVVIYCNYETEPCIDAPKFFGQYKFFIEGSESSGWCPEMEFEDIEILDEYADCNIWDCDHKYLIVIVDRKTAKESLGNYGKTCNLPCIIGRMYATKQHDYVKTLAKGAEYMYNYKNTGWKRMK